MLTERQKLMSVDEAAEYLGFHPEYVRRLARQGRLKGLKAGRQGRAWRFRPEDLDAVLEEGGRTDDT